MALEMVPAPKPMSDTEVIVTNKCRFQRGKNRKIVKYVQKTSQCCLFFSSSTFLHCFFSQAYCRLNVLPSPTTDCKFLTKFTSLTPQTSLFICPNLQMCAIPSLPLCLLLSSCSLQLRDWLSRPPRWCCSWISAPWGLNLDHPLQ